ncbi:MAG: right-handed parallel beta-helix repeat-containing protein [Gemmatimonadaceae bacterium]
MSTNSRVARFVAVLSLGLPTIAIAGSPTKVYPTGFFPEDVSSVRAAVAQGGQVILEATDISGMPTAFNFGPSVPGNGTVFLTTDVILSGTSAAGQRTTIMGGSAPIQVLSPIHFTIRGLQFINPFDAAINVEASRDAVITDNVVENVVPADQRDGTTEGFGIVVNSSSGPTSNITGNVVIARNDIDGVPADAGYGIVSAHHDANVIIEGNKVSNINLNGILAGDISAHAFILNNFVVPGPGTNPDFTSGNGIFVGHARGGRFSISNNTVICDNIQADGISVIASTELPVEGSSIVDNDVTMLGSLYGGVSLYDSPSHVLVANNTIHGNGAYALQIAVAVSPPPSAIGNTFEDNSVADFSPATSDVSLDINAAETVLCNQPGTVVDNGIGTIVTARCPFLRAR